jgi:tetratricopeptide (TPR) repeat protein
MRQGETMYELKPLSRNALPGALEKADRYRLLNEPVEAESICRDVLVVDPENQRALVMLLLSLTDQFDEGFSEALKEALGVLPHLADEYTRTYYAGIISERRAKALQKRGGPGTSYVAYESFREAMAWYEKAEALRSPGNDDALLRWNTCARILLRHRNLRSAPNERTEAPLE